MKSCVILGGTGLIGQQFVRLLEKHPLLNLSGIYASEASAGKSMQELWNLPGFDIPEQFRDMRIENILDIDPENLDVDIAFSGLPTSIAEDLENNLRNNGVAVFSNASAHRMDDDVPILIPEINAKHAELVKLQREKTGSEGFVVTNANCSVTGAAMYIHEIKQLLPIESAVISTYQALSGAGIRGVSSIQIANNVIPYIQNEEIKMKIEGKKILGTLDNDLNFTQDPMQIYANCARVAVIDGHLEAITIFSRNKEFTEENITSALLSLKSPLSPLSDYHIAPKTHLRYLSDDDRPQPRVDVNYGETPVQQGMTTSVGRIRKDNSVLKAYILVHNTIRGGAGGSVLNAEYMINNKYI